MSILLQVYFRSTQEQGNKEEKMNEIERTRADQGDEERRRKK